MTLEATSIYNAVNDIDEDNPMPSRNHARVAQFLSSYLQIHYGERLEIYHQLSLNLNDWKTVPDVCAYPVGSLPYNWKEDEAEVTKAPCLAIEILSPFQATQPLALKIDRYLAEGVDSCWLVMPVTRSVFVYAPGAREQVFFKGDLRDEVADITIPLDKIFR